MTRMFEGEPLDEKRSRHMAKIRGKNTKPELQLRKALWALGARYRVHVDGVPGTPDVCNQAAKVAVFVDGCFWHGCPRHYTLPKTRRDYWEAKVRRNQEKRREVIQDLEGWRVYEFYECELRGDSTIPARVADAIAKR